jgi:hypothetical protein
MNWRDLSGFRVSYAELQLQHVMQGKKMIIHVAELLLKALLDEAEKSKAGAEAKVEAMLSQIKVCAVLRCFQGFCVIHPTKLKVVSWKSCVFSLSSMP